MNRTNKAVPMRFYAALTLSAALLAFCISQFHELFFFYKVVTIPSWATYLPGAFYLAEYFVAICLLPAAFLPRRFSDALKSVLLVVLIALIPAVIQYALASASDDYVWENSAWHYLWSIGWHCILPALIVLAARFGVQGTMSGQID